MTKPGLRNDLVARFRRVRQASVAMCESLEPAEFRVQPMDDVSPPWWNLAHTSWFFARNVLGAFGGREEIDATYDYLLNSYYASLGERISRSQRGHLTRPTTEEVFAYRASVDGRLLHLMETIGEDQLENVATLVRIGIEHEQQHQELFYTEIKYILAANPPPLRRAYQPRDEPIHSDSSVIPLRFVSFEGGLHEFGNKEGEWCWDNESPIHKYFLTPFALADRLVTCGEYLEFIQDGGYDNQLLWLDNGWQQRQTLGWTAPLYWERHDDAWQVFTLSGSQPLQHSEPVSHVSFYEADAYARWREATSADFADARLPSEREWEHAARTKEVLSAATAFVDSGHLHPQRQSSLGLREMAGVLWQWTHSYYEPYSGYRPYPGVLAEYNGKFMDNQRVLRGGSCATPRDHYRASYRNFWPPATRFQFTGVRLARNL